MKNNKIDKHPNVQMDESLNRYKDVVLFPEKLAKANETLRKIGLPEGMKKKEKQERM